MTTAHDIDWPAVLADRLTTTHPDVLRELLSTFIHTLLGAEADPSVVPVTVSAAASGSISATGTGIVNSTPGRGHWIWRSKLRHGSYFPDWLLERRKRAERALTTVVATCYLLGCPPGGWTSSSKPSDSPACRSRRSR